MIQQNWSGKCKLRNTIDSGASNLMYQTEVTPFHPIR